MAVTTITEKQYNSITICSQTSFLHVFQSFSGVFQGFVPLSDLFTRVSLCGHHFGSYCAFLIVWLPFWLPLCIPQPRNFPHIVYYTSLAPLIWRSGQVVPSWPGNAAVPWSFCGTSFLVNPSYCLASLSFVNINKLPSVTIILCL